MPDRRAYGRLGRFAGLSMLVVSAGSAPAQLGTGSFLWEASADNGLTWSALQVVGPRPRTVLVRAVASWSLDSGIAFASSQFDVVVSGASTAESVTNMFRPYPLDTDAQQTVVATRFGSTIKIDDSRDTLPAGAGNRGVFPAQAIFGFDPPTTYENPLVLFTFNLHLDGTPGTREISQFFVALPGGNTIDRVLRVYTDVAGHRNFPTVGSYGARIVVLPAPSGVVCVAGGLAVWARRRRDTDR